VRDNGEIETGGHNLDEVQKKFNTQLEKVYPRIAYVPKIIRDNGLQALAVIIPGSPLRPHFAGLSYVRRGSVSLPASEEQYEELIASRTSKTNEILKWKDELVTVNRLNVGNAIRMIGRIGSTMEMRVEKCNAFYVTLTNRNWSTISFPLASVEISFDDAKSRLALETPG